MSPMRDPRAPFFILGCVRSGTTMLRDILRRHPNLDAPEETHFFRSAEPFGTDAYTQYFLRNTVLKRHRQMDGIEEQEFADMLAAADSRADLYRRYMDVFLQRRKPTANRWFEKTPQNVYGAALIAADLPDAKFVHIVRNPLNVISSLRIGKVVKVESLVGACNYWIEAAQIIATIKQACPGRVFEVRYEDFAVSPLDSIEKMLSFLGEPFEARWFADVHVDAKEHDAARYLSEEERARVHRLCGPAARRYGYFDDAPAGESAAVPRELRGLAEAVEIVQQRLAAPSGRPSTPACATRVLVQYWDREPPDQVTALLKHNRGLCEAAGIRYELFDDARARGFIAREFSADVLAAYDIAPHAAMRADLFRLCFLAREGGFYLDADMALRSGFADLFDLAAEVFVFAWNSHDRRNICNWLIGAAPGAPAIEYVLDATARSILSACRRDPKEALKGILGVSGPGIVTRAIATLLAGGPDRLASSIFLSTVTEAYQRVQNGPEFLKQKLAYKDSTLHWEVAARRT